MSEIKLLPCPFCGGESTTHSTIVLHKGEYVRVYGCMCKKSHCVILPANYFTQEKAAEKWNTRKPIDRMVEQFEKCVEWDGYTLDIKRRGVEIIKAGGKSEK